jgi:NAD(P)-dependent dehydrogenase (short-subunit alcohol dehydrogenase family)
MFEQIGKVCALELAKKNAHVFIASRTPSKALAALEEIKAESKNEKIEFIQVDLSSLASVTKFVSEFKAKELPLDLLKTMPG